MLNGTGIYIRHYSVTVVGMLSQAVSKINALKVTKFESK